MSGIAPVLDAVNVIMRRLGDLPDGPEVTELRDRAFDCIEEVVASNTARASSEKRQATMVRVLALHVATNKVASVLQPELRRARVVDPLRLDRAADELLACSGPHRPA